MLPLHRRCEIDEEICRLRLRIQRLLFERNHLSPIHTLPADVLTNIFGLLPDDRTGSDVLFTIAWVCQYWRALVLDTPTLWTTLNFRNQHMLDCALTLSKKAPLSIKLAGSTRLQWALEKIIPHMSRVVNLDISMSDTFHPVMDVSLGQMHALLANGRACTLQRLSLNQCDVWGCSLASAAPRLRELRLSNCSHSWWADILPSNLISLEIERPHNQIHFRDIPRFLQGLPRLKSVTLTSCCPRPGNIAEEFNHLTMDDSDRIFLPHFERLSMDDHSHSILGALNGLSFPADTTFNLHFSDGKAGSHPTLMRSLAIVLSHCQPSPPPLFQLDLSLGIRQSRAHPMITFTRQDLSPTRHTTSPALRSTFDLYTTLSWQQPWNALQHFSFICLERLELSTTFGDLLPPAFHSVYEFQNTLGHLPGLKAISVTHGFVPLLYDYFVQERDGPWRDPKALSISEMFTTPLLHSSSTLVPSRRQAEAQAQCLAFKFCALRELKIVYDGETPQHTLLSSFIRWRAILSIPLEKLSFNNDPGDSSMVEFRRFVGDVVRLDA